MSNLAVPRYVELVSLDLSLLYVYATSVELQAVVQEIYVVPVMLHSFQLDTCSGEDKLELLNPSVVYVGFRMSEESDVGIGNQIVIHTELQASGMEIHDRLVFALFFGARSSSGC